MRQFLIIAGLVVWIVAGMAELISLAPTAVDYAPINQAEHNEKGEGSANDKSSLIRIVTRRAFDVIHDNRDDINAVSTVIIAIFTMILAIFTISLARSTRTAAEAARLSADVIPNMESPYVYVDGIITEIFPPQRIELSSGEIVSQHGYANTRISFFNYGRTPADLLGMKFFSSFLDHVPCTQDTTARLENIERLKQTPFDGVIGSDKSWTSPDSGTSNALDQTEWARFERNEIALYVWGWLQFGDIFNRVAKTYFCRRYDRQLKTWDVVGESYQNRTIRD